VSIFMANRKAKHGKSNKYIRQGVFSEVNGQEMNGRNYET
jgi:hypothetical protein